MSIFNTYLNSMFETAAVKSMKKGYEVCQEGGDDPETDSQGETTPQEVVDTGKAETGVDAGFDPEVANQVANELKSSSST